MRISQPLMQIHDWLDVLRTTAADHAPVSVLVMASNVAESILLSWNCELLAKKVAFLRSKMSIVAYQQTSPRAAPGQDHSHFLPELDVENQRVQVRSRLIVFPRPIVRYPMSRGGTVHRLESIRHCRPVPIQMSSMSLSITKTTFTYE